MAEKKGHDSSTTDVLQFCSIDYGGGEQGIQCVVIFFFFFRTGLMDHIYKRNGTLKEEINTRKWRWSNNRDAIWCTTLKKKKKKRYRIFPALFFIIFKYQHWWMNHITKPNIQVLLYRIQSLLSRYFGILQGLRQCHATAFNLERLWVNYGEGYGLSSLS